MLGRMICVLMGLIGLGFSASTALAVCASDHCCIEFRCCSADGGACGANDTCSCTVICGPGTGSCPCKCYPYGEIQSGPGDFTPETLRPLLPQMDRAIALNQEVGINLTNGTLTLKAMARELEDLTFWRVVVAPEIAVTRPLVSNDYLDTYARVIDAIAADYRVDVTVSDHLRTIVFSGPTPIIPW